MTDLEKVERELERYEHPLVRFAVNTCSDGSLELLIGVRDGGPKFHTYLAPLHSRDLTSPQFPWMFQRYLYDCLHDYVVELFVRTPQIRDGNP